MIQINRHSSEPIYLQVKRLLLDDISAGRIRAREAIPNERELADDLGLSRMTVRRAILELAEEGIVERIRGRGTFVRPQERPGQRGSANTGARTFAVVAGQDQTRIRDDLFYHRILQGIQEATGALGGAISYRKPSENLSRKSRGWRLTPSSKTCKLSSRASASNRARPSTP